MRPNGHGGVSGVRDGDRRRTDGEGASGTCVWDGHAARPAMGRGAVGDGTTADKRIVGEGVRMNERPYYCVGHWTDKDERVGIRFSVSERQREMGPARAEPRPDKSHGRTTVAYHYRNL